MVIVCRWNIIGVCIEKGTCCLSHFYTFFNFVEMKKITTRCVYLKNIELLAVQGLRP